MLRWFSRFLLVALLIILSVVTTALFLVWSQTRREYAAFEARRVEAEAQLAALRAERQHKEDYLRTFLSEPEFAERVIRERMGYVAPGEVVFRFENP